MGVTDEVAKMAPTLRNYLRILTHKYIGWFLV